MSSYDEIAAEVAPVAPPLALAGYVARLQARAAVAERDAGAVGETSEDVYRAALDRLDEARRRLDAALIASAHRLETPFSNAPETSPWERSVKPALNRLRTAIGAVRAAHGAAVDAALTIERQRIEAGVRDLTAGDPVTADEVADVVWGGHRA